MDEPLSSALFDFDFERTDSISGRNLEVARSEVRARIFEEVLLYRPSLARMIDHDTKMDYGGDYGSDRMDDQPDADTKQSHK